jgi:hypothetical protein
MRGEIFLPRHNYHLPQVRTQDVSLLWAIGTFLRRLDIGLGPSLLHRSDQTLGDASSPWLDRQNPEP